MSWYETIAIKFFSNVSNVIIASTYDHKRISQFLSSLRVNAETGTSEIDTLLKTKFQNKLIYDIQREKIFDATSGTGLSTTSVFGGGSLEVLDSKLCSAPTFVVISYVFLQRHAERLTDYLSAWSQDPKLYEKRSKVIVFCSDYSLFNPGLLRLTYAFDIPLPSEEERRVLLNKFAEDIRVSKNLPPDALVVNQQVVNATAGLTLHDIETALLESFYTTRDISIPVFTRYKVNILKNFGMVYVEPSRGFDSVGGYEYLKEYITQRVINVIKNPELANELGLRMPKGILLYGPPGTGKTWFAKAMAKELGLPMITLNPADMMRGIVGESEARVRQISLLVEGLAPVAVFIDEMDQMFLARGTTFMGDSGVSRRVTNMLLEWLGDYGRRAFIIGASNFLKDIDPAVLRPGRIDEVVMMLYPDQSARRDIIKVQVKLKGVPTKDVDFEYLSENTFMWSSAELEKLVLEASARAFAKRLNVVTQNEFEEALSTFRVNVEGRMNRMQQMVAELEALESINQSFLRESLKALARAEKDERMRSMLEVI